MLVMPGDIFIEAGWLINLGFEKSHGLYNYSESGGNSVQEGTAFWLVVINVSSTEAV